MRKLYTCLFYGLCVFTIAFSLFWMALPRLTLPSPAGSETPPSSAEESLAAQALPELSAQGYLLQDKGGRVAVYRCDADGTAGALLTVTGIYTNLLPENDALRIKQGIRGAQRAGAGPAAGRPGRVSRALTLYVKSVIFY